jgi:hypothetical protein
MSYICQLCGQAVKEKIRAIRLVTRTREKFYPYRAKANPGFQTKNGQVIRPLRKSNKRNDRIDDPGGKGVETVEEIAVCPNCSKNIEQ